MKVLCSQAVDIRAPAETVFDYVCDLTRWPTWFGCVVSASQPKARPLALGEEVHVCMHAGRRRWQEHLEITRYIRNAFLSLEALYSTSRRIDFRVERRGRTTRLGCSIGYPVYGGLVPVALDVVFGRRRVKNGLRDSLVHLKNLLEEQAGVAAAADDVDISGVVAKPTSHMTAQTARVS